MSGFFGRLFGRRSLPVLRSTNRFRQVVGESHFQSNLEKIAGRKTDSGVRQKYRCKLLLDDGNAHDANAVKVEISGLCVGYLSREDASIFRDNITVGAVLCECQIIGGWKRDGDDEGNFGVKLKIKWPPEIEE